MTPDDRRELARTAKFLDLAARALPPVLRPLALQAVELLLTVNPHQGGSCVVCGMVPDRHRCSCPFSPGALPKWLKQQRRAAA